MRDIYRKIAKENGITVAEVKRDMQAAIDHAYQRNDKPADIVSAQRKIPSRDKIPTTTEFIQYTSRIIHDTNHPKAD